MTYSTAVFFDLFILEWNPLERLDCSRTSYSDRNGQKHHFLYLVVHEIIPIDTGVRLCVTLQL